MVNSYSVIITLVLAVLRMSGVHNQSYQAAAHLFLGWLVGASYYQYRATWTTGGNAAMVKVWLAILLTLVEVACFLWFKFFAS